MRDRFDPYHRWLGIAPDEQPADHYRLLGLKPFETNPDVIETAADRQMAHLRSYQSGEHAADAERLLNEVSVAKLVLLRPAEKSAYDAQLQARRMAATKVHEPAMSGGITSATTPSQSASATTPPAPPPDAPPLTGPAIQTHVAKRSGPNMVALAGVAALILLLLVGGAIAFVVKPWESNTPVANNDNSNPPTPPEVIAPSLAEDSNGSIGSAQVSNNGSARVSENGSARVSENGSARVSDPAEPPTEGLTESANTPNPSDNDSGTTTSVAINTSDNVGNVGNNDPLALNPDTSGAAQPAEPPTGSTADQSKPGDDSDSDNQPPDNDDGDVLAQAADAAPPETAESPKHPVPDKAARDAARAKIEGIFPIAEANTPEKKLALARQMLTTAKDTKNDPMSQFVLLNMVRELAAEQAQARLAMEAVDLLESNFDFDVTGVRLATLGTAVKSQVPFTEKKEVLSVGIEMIDAMIARDEYEAAGKLTTPLLDIARRARDKELLQALVERRKEAARLHDAYTKVATAFETLETDPDNGDALVKVGEFLLFTKGDWPRALNALANGSDALLRIAARGELNRPIDAVKKRELADAWWKISEQETDTSKSGFYRGMAALWYREAIHGLKGLDKAATQRRIESVDTQDIYEAIQLTMSDPSNVETTFLDNIAESESKMHGRLGKGNSGRNTMGGTVPLHALQTHAAGKDEVFVTYELDGSYDLFRGMAGIWVGKPPAANPNAQSPLVFSVEGDGEILWKSRPIQRHGDAEQFEVIIRGVRELTLRVQCGGGNQQAWSAWANPQIIRCSLKEPDLGIFSRDPSELRTSSATERGLVALWAFDEGSGTVVRDAAGGLFGTTKGAVWTDGIRGSALTFRGNSAVGIGNPEKLNFDGTITLAAWVRLAKLPPDVKNDSRIFNVIAHGFDYDAQRELRLSVVTKDGGTVWQLAVWKSNSIRVESPVDKQDIGEWVHLAATYDGRSWRLYRNGEQVAIRDSDLGAVTVAKPWAIGAHANEKDRTFHGDIDDVRIYNRALSAEEVAALATSD